MPGDGDRNEQGRPVAVSKELTVRRSGRAEEITPNRCLPLPREDRSALSRRRVEGGSCLQTRRSFCSLELSLAE